MSTPKIRPSSNCLRSASSLSILEPSDFCFTLRSSPWNLGLPRGGLRGLQDSGQLSVEGRRLGELGLLDHALQQRLQGFADDRASPRAGGEEAATDRCFDDRRTVNRQILDAQRRFLSDDLADPGLESLVLIAPFRKPTPDNVGGSQGELVAELLDADAPHEAS